MHSNVYLMFHEKFKKFLQKVSEANLGGYIKNFLIFKSLALSGSNLAVSMSLNLSDRTDALYIHGTTWPTLYITHQEKGCKHLEILKIQKIHPLGKLICLHKIST